MPYHDIHWSDYFGPKCDPPVFGVLHPPKYFGNLILFISHAISNFQKCWSLTVATLVAHHGEWVSPGTQLSSGITPGKAKGWISIYGQMATKALQRTLKPCQDPEYHTACGAVSSL